MMLATLKVSYAINRQLIYLEESDRTPTVHEHLNRDSWIAEENDCVNPSYREKRKLIF